jgi:hypothetical protein
MSKMNGQQIGKENTELVIAWLDQKDNLALKEYIFRDSLNRKAIAAEIGVSKSSLYDNPTMRDAIESREELLREDGTLPKKSERAPSQGLPVRQNTSKSRDDAARASRLEQENASIKAELADIRTRLRKFEILDQYLQESGRLPR